MPDSKYTFAAAFAAETIADGRYSKSVTAENLTDADAEALLKLGYGHVIQLKPGKEAAAKDEAPAGDQPQPSARETELEKQVATSQQALNTEKEAHAATKTKAADTLKAEKEAHKATKKELTAVSTKLADTEKELKEAQAKIAELSKPTAPPADEAGTAD